MTIEHNNEKTAATSLHQNPIPLTGIPLSSRARIISIDGSSGVWERLHEVGLHIGDHVTVIRHAPLDGPLLIACNGHEIAISRNIASKIFALEIL